MEKPNTKTSLVEKINQEINTEFSNEATQRALIATTFKGFELPIIKQAIMEAMIRGWKFDDFLKKHIYAVKFGGSYALVTSIDYVRKIAMRSGHAGTSLPTYTFKPDGEVETCSITVKRLIGNHIAEYSALVYFDEYKNNNNPMWSKSGKPKSMIAKVTEMHSLRKAFPEEMFQQYVEEEFERGPIEQRIAKVDEEVDRKELIMGRALIKNENNNNQEAESKENEVEIVATASGDEGINTEIDLSDITNTL